MSNSNKKNINWLIDEFTSIDLVPSIKKSNVKSSETFTEIDEDGKKYSFRSSLSENDNEGRPLSLKNFDPKGKLIEEYKYTYNDNVQKIELFENGRKSCVWTHEYNDKDLLIKTEYTESTDDSHDIDSFTYDKEGRLVKVLMDVYPQEIEDEEPATGYDLEWNENKLLSVSEVYGEEEEAKIIFQYDENGQLTSVKKYIYLIDEDDEEVEEVIDEQTPKFDNRGRLIENIINYYNSNSKLAITYKYKDDDELPYHTNHKDYDNGKLVRSIDFYEDEKGNLLKSVEQFHQAKAVKTDNFSYNNL